MLLRIFLEDDSMLNHALKWIVKLEIISFKSLKMGIYKTFLEFVLDFLLYLDQSLHFEL